MPPRRLPDTLRSLSDADWFKLLARSINEPVIDGIEFPGFPPAALQQHVAGQSGEATLRQAYSFYVFAKTQMVSLGRSLTHESRFLDFGCGWGRFLRFFWKDVDEANLFGCDTDRMIVERCEQLGVPGHVAVVESLGRLPYPDAFFDGVLSYDVFTHLPEAVHRHWARELARVCRPGAVVCLTVEARRFLETIAGLPPDAGAARLARLRRLLPVLARHVTEYETHGFTHFPSPNGGADDHGDAVVSAGFIARTWGDAFDLKTYIDHASQMEQTAVCLQRLSPDGLPFSIQIEREVRDIARSGLFDPAFYTAMYPDIQPPPLDPLHHYCARGWRDGLDPSDDFDTNAYRTANPDVAAAAVNPLWHYVVRGRREGRTAVAEAAPGYENDAAFGSVPEDVTLIAYYVDPEWSAMRRGHAAAHDAGQSLTPHPDLDFYDVTRADTLRTQASMCRKHGIAAWCFPVDGHTSSAAAHPLKTFLDAGDVRIGFMLDVDLREPTLDAGTRKLVARALADERYLRCDGRPAMILSLPAGDDVRRAALAVVDDLFAPGGATYRIARQDDPASCMGGAGERRSFDAVLDFPMSPIPGETGGFAPRPHGGVDTVPYRVVVSNAIARMGDGGRIASACHRTVTVGRDGSTPGRQRPLRYTRPTLKQFRRWLDAAIDDARTSLPVGSRLVFLNAWNDWRRGAMLEPDRFTGYGRLNETSRALVGIESGVPFPKVSVIVVGSTHAGRLRRRLESVYVQTYGNIEVLLIDDDGTARSLFDEYIGRFPSVATRVLATPGVGLFRRWAQGLRAASGDLVWFAGGDGFCDRNFLATLVRCFDDEAVLVATSKIEFVDNDDAVIPDGFHSHVHTLACRDKWRHSYVNTAHREVAEAFGIVNTVPSAGGAVVRRPVALPLLDDDEWLSMKFAGDWIFLLHAMRGGKIAYTTDTCAFVRMPAVDTETARSAAGTVARECSVVARTVRSLYDTPPFTREAFHAINPTPPTEGTSAVPPVTRRKRTPNIAVALMGFYPGGAEIQPIRLANELKRQGHSVVLLSAGFGTREPRVRSLVRNDVPVVETRDVNLTKQVLHDFGIEALNTHAWIVQNYPSLVPDVFAGLAAHVATLHGMIEHGNESTASPENLRRADQQVSTWVYTADKNLGPFIEQGLHDAYSPRFVKLPNGMEPPVINPLHRRDVGIPDDAFVLCCASRAIRDKGWAESIEAVARARMMTGRDIRLMLVGKGELHDEYSRTGVPDFVSLMGFRENAIDFYAAADMGILLTTFKSESFPLTIIEGLLAGRPFLATDVGDIRGMLSTARGLAGDVIDLVDWRVPVDRAAEAIARHASHPQIVQAAQARAAEVAQRFHIDRVAAEYVALFERDVDASSRTRIGTTTARLPIASWAAALESRRDETIDAMVDHFAKRRPAWVTGDVGAPDARFLLQEALDARTSHLVEIGTASGMSTGLLGLALAVARRAGLVGIDCRVVSYDLSRTFYADTSRNVGDAARELLDAEPLSRIVFRNPADARDVARDHAPDTVRFLFIDANHLHPWPALDFLATLPVLASGATVVLHDVNLPLIEPRHSVWGAHHLFNGLSLAKRLAPEGYRPGDPPNVGSVVVPQDKGRLREELLRIVAAHPWEMDVPDAVLAALGVPRR